MRERDGQNYVCECLEHFSGIACEYRDCPVSVDGLTCSNRGACQHSTGTCTCNEGYYGNDCSLKDCPRNADGQLCNGQGTCFPSSVSANHRQDGSSVDKHRTQSSSVQGGVFCRNVNELGTVWMPDGSVSSSCRPVAVRRGTCSCSWPYYGTDCTLKLCPVGSTNSESGTGLQCDGHGACDTTTGVCNCDAGHFGLDCTKRGCPYGSNNEKQASLECNGVGVCDRNWGTCACKPKYHGPACDQLRCAAGWAGSADECGGVDHGTCDGATGLCTCISSGLNSDSRKSCGTIPHGG